MHASTARSPGPQVPHAVGAAVRSEYVPGWHATHPVPAAGAMVPAGHGAHAARSGLAERPRGHPAPHAVKPGWEKGRSAGQAAHADDPSTGACGPGPHRLHATCPTEEEAPAAHRAHADCPAAE